MIPMTTQPCPIIVKSLKQLTIEFIALKEILFTKETLVCDCIEDIYEYRLKKYRTTSNVDYAEKLKDNYFMKIIFLNVKHYYWGNRVIEGINWAVEHDEPEVLKHLEEIVPSSDVVWETVVKTFPTLKGVKYLISTGKVKCSFTYHPTHSENKACPSLTAICKYAAGAGNLEVLEYILSLNPLVRWNKILFKAITHRQVEAVKYIVKMMRKYDIRFEIKDAYNKAGPSIRVLLP
jgi:hypothetical protein